MRSDTTMPGAEAPTAGEPQPARSPAATSAARRGLYLREWVYGGLDGAVTTFAVVAGVAGASLSTAVVLILGFANLVADGFSMAAGAYSAAKAEREQYDRDLRETRQRIAADPDRARAALGEALAAHGINSSAGPTSGLDPNHDQFAEMLLLEEQGITRSPRGAYQAAGHTFVAFLVCGIIPLLPYLVGGGFEAAAVGTVAVFFAIGSLKSRWTAAPWWRSGLGTLGVGVTAAVIAYLVGLLLRGIVDTTV